MDQLTRAQWAALGRAVEGTMTAEDRSQLCDLLRTAGAISITPEQVSIFKGKYILVLGSINNDMIMKTDRLPSRGVNQPAYFCRTMVGGKGANEAVGLALLEQPCVFVGRTGADSIGMGLVQTLRRYERLQVEIERDDTHATGIAIAVSCESEKLTVPHKGANNFVGNAELARVEAHLRTDCVSTLLMQFEIDLNAVLKAAKMAKDRQVRTVLRGSPLAEPVDPAVFGVLNHIDVLVVNEIELPLLLDIKGTVLRSVPALHEAARRLSGKYPHMTIIVISGFGIVCRSSTDGAFTIPMSDVQVKFVIGAGDAFTSGIVVGLEKGLPLRHACAYAACCSALSTTADAGSVVESLPTLVQVVDFMATRKILTDEDLWPATDHPDWDGLQALLLPAAPAASLSRSSSKSSLSPADEPSPDAAPDPAAGLLDAIRGLTLEMLTETTDFQGQTLLHAAVVLGHADAVAAIVFRADGSAKQLLEQPDSYGFTALQRAVHIAAIHKKDRHASIPAQSICHALAFAHIAAEAAYPEQALAGEYDRLKERISQIRRRPVDMPRNLFLAGMIISPLPAIRAAGIAQFVRQAVRIEAAGEQGTRECARFVFEMGFAFNQAIKEYPADGLTTGDLYLPADLQARLRLYPADSFSSLLERTSVSMPGPPPTQPPPTIRPIRVVVLGSISMDFFVTMTADPVLGNTCKAEELKMVPGGKGGNEAVTIQKLGVACMLIGRVGDDPMGQSLLTALDAEGILARVEKDLKSPTGIALVVVSVSNKTTIPILLANNQVGTHEIAALQDALRQHSATLEYVVLQLEVPVEIVIEAARLAWKNKVKVVLKTSPLDSKDATRLPRELFGYVSILVVNEWEAAILLQEQKKRYTTIRELRDAATRLATMWDRPLTVVAVSGFGIVCVHAGEVAVVPPLRVTVVDYVGAADAYCGSLVAALVEGYPLRLASVFASFCSGYMTERRHGPGAQASLPTMEMALEFLESRGLSRAALMDDKRYLPPTEEFVAAIAMIASLDDKDAARIASHEAVLSQCDYLGQTALHQAIVYGNHAAACVILRKLGTGDIIQLTDIYGMHSMARVRDMLHHSRRGPVYCRIGQALLAAVLVYRPRLNGRDAVTPELVCDAGYLGLLQDLGLETHADFQGIEDLTERMVLHLLFGPDADTHSINLGKVLFERRCSTVATAEAFEGLQARLTARKIPYWHVAARCGRYPGPSERIPMDAVLGRDQFGRIPLHYAGMAGNISGCERFWSLMLRDSAQRSPLEFKDDDGKTVLDLCAAEIRQDLERICGLRRVFVSYRRKAHIDFLNAMLDRLRGHHFEIWRDDREWRANDDGPGIPAGTDWQSYIVQQIQRCASFLVYFTETFCDSEYCMAELRIAKQYDRNIIVVFPPVPADKRDDLKRLASRLPVEIQNRQFAHFDPADNLSGYHAIFESEMFKHVEGSLLVPSHINDPPALSRNTSYEGGRSVSTPLGPHEESPPRPLVQRSNSISILGALSRLANDAAPLADARFAVVCAARPQETSKDAWLGAALAAALTRAGANMGVNLKTALIRMQDDDRDALRFLKDQCEVLIVACALVDRDSPAGTRHSGALTRREDRIAFLRKVIDAYPRCRPIYNAGYFDAPLPEMLFSDHVRGSVEGDAQASFFSFVNWHSQQLEALWENHRTGAFFVDEFFASQFDRLLSVLKEEHPEEMAV
eukprot:m.101767 g.101767  ORF g.101767 m.101767 type:complete len:1696 (-) comp8801_c0_seq1:297-5384(-)